MISVRCIVNDRARLTSESTKERLSRTMRTVGPIQELDLGAIYDVWAIEQWDDGGLRVYVHAEPSHWFPTPYPVEFFDFVDSRLPENWTIAVKGAGLFRISFPEWSRNRLFYEKLVDRDPVALAAYQRHRDLVER
jgi:hypothetical protein